jgi:hypothetical protein
MQMIKRKREESPHSQISRKDKIKNLDKNTYKPIGNNHLEKNISAEPFYHQFERKKYKKSFRNNTFIDGKQQQNFDSKNKSYFR